jgi:hypothetical protein
VQLHKTDILPTRIGLRYPINRRVGGSQILDAGNKRTVFMYFYPSSDRIIILDFSVVSIVNVLAELPEEGVQKEKTTSDM